MEYISNDDLISNEKGVDIFYVYSFINNKRIKQEQRVIFLLTPDMEKKDLWYKYKKYFIDQHFNPIIAYIDHSLKIRKALLLEWESFK